ncbi:sigma-54-dependent transcriptional regulator [Marinobacter xestospongiae]|uniref:DNA-binding transcriptional regulator NtrC n=1 Tax=Marinobacter xestospongiae TaxID=994319 RepID=A0ABU3VXK6_9GAMM|nr:sigma-54 dependent transcriptional regulator [Marinobacter xestospongiae]MDV2079012.1 sigma-54 dependent transcriptional regulator [Marinobacter xestospongiae]
MPQKPPHPPLLLLVDDQPANLDVLVDYLQDSGLSLAVSINGNEALQLARRRKPSLILLDVMMPVMDGFEVCRRLKAHHSTRNVPVIFMSALDDTDSKVRGFEAGAVDFVTKPLHREEVLARIHTHLTIRQQQLELKQKNRDLQALNAALKEQAGKREQAESALHQMGEQLSTLTRQEASKWGIDAFVGNSDATRAVLSEIRNLQRVDKTPVLVLGESGTGKELVSRAIHFGSSRNTKPFITVNCAAIPPDLADAELFGHVKGSFTGATHDRPGVFVQADGGTLFLDEIGDMPLAQQAKLLRVLENGEVTPVGGTQPQKVDVRVVAATNIALPSKVQNRAFRQDLYYRLAGYIIQLPPLRLRREDIPLLVQHFLTGLGQQMGRERAEITEEAVAVLQSYDYPGNIRELRNLIEYALISSRGAAITPEHLHFIHQPAGQPLPEATRPASAVATAGPREEQNLLAYVADHGVINNTTAQQVLGVSHSRASYLLKKLLREGQLEKHGERRWAHYSLPGQ